MGKKPYNIVYDCVDRHSLKKERVALICLEEKAGKITRQQFTFAQIQERVSDFAKSLKYPRGARVVVQLPNGIDFIAAFLGSIKAGLIPIPVSPQLTQKELDFIVKDSGAVAIFALTNWQMRACNTYPSAKAKGSAYWLYTSGTTGIPKAVMQAHTSIPAHDARVKYWMDLKKDDILFNTSALNWSYALTSLLDAWRHGVTVVVYQGELSAEKIIRVIQKEKVTVLMSVPGLYRRLSEQSFKSSLRVALSAGEKLPEEIRERFFEKTNLTIREGLGMSEHSVYLAQRKDRPIVAHSCGQLFPGQKITILKEKYRRGENRNLPAGELGILASHKSCKGLMLGYYRRDQEMKKAFWKNWFLSGDLAYKDKKGNFSYVGRRDDMLNSGGFRISPLEIEKALNQCSSVSESAVVGREVSAGKTIVTAYVVLKKGFKSQPEKILSELSLAPYKKPREIIFVKHLPKTHNGKIKRKSLSTSSV